MMRLAHFRCAAITRLLTIALRVQRYATAGNVATNMRRPMALVAHAHPLTVAYASALSLDV